MYKCEYTFPMYVIYIASIHYNEGGLTDIRQEGLYLVLSGTIRLPEVCIRLCFLLIKKYIKYDTNYLFDDIWVKNIIEKE